MMYIEKYKQNAVQVSKQVENALKPGEKFTCMDKYTFMIKYLLFMCSNNYSEESAPGITVT